MWTEDSPVPDISLTYWPSYPVLTIPFYHQPTVLCWQKKNTNIDFLIRNRLVNSFSDVCHMTMADSQRHKLLQTVLCCILKAKANPQHGNLKVVIMWTFNHLYNDNHPPATWRKILYSKKVNYYFAPKNIQQNESLDICSSNAAVSSVVSVVLLLHFA